MKNSDSQVATFAVSALASNNGRMGKPFNPLLGETYQLEQDDFRIFCEQVDILNLGDEESNLRLLT